MGLLRRKHINGCTFVGFSRNKNLPLAMHSAQNAEK
jgi:hypothetical protein